MFSGLLPRSYSARFNRSQCSVNSTEGPGDSMMFSNEQEAAAGTTTRADSVSTTDLERQSRRAGHQQDSEGKQPQERNLEVEAIKARMELARALSELDQERLRLNQFEMQLSACRDDNARLADLNAGLSQKCEMLQALLDEKSASHLQLSTKCNILHKEREDLKERLQTSITEGSGSATSASHGEAIGKNEQEVSAAGTAEDREKILQRCLLERSSQIEHLRFQIDQITTERDECKKDSERLRFHVEKMLHSDERDEQGNMMGVQQLSTTNQKGAAAAKPPRDGDEFRSKLREEQKRRLKMRLHMALDRKSSMAIHSTSSSDDPAKSGVAPEENDGHVKLGKASTADEYDEIFRRSSLVQRKPGFVLQEHGKHPKDHPRLAQILTDIEKQLSTRDVSSDDSAQTCPSEVDSTMTYDSKKRGGFAA